MKNKVDYLKIVAIVLVFIIIISAAIILVRLWENNHNYFPESVNKDGIVKYQGTEYELNPDIESYLLIGLDKYTDAFSSDSHESGIQADFIMVLVFDNENQTCIGLQINRDTVTQVNRLSIGGTAVVATYTKQIALAYAYVEDDNAKIRCGNTKDSVEHLLKCVDINHYFAVTMDGVVTLNDLLGGVEVEVLNDFTGIDDSLIKGETVTLIGEQALRYVRARKGLEDSSNIARMERQKQYLNALYDKLESRITEDDEFSLSLVEKMSEHIVYDLSEQKIQKLAEKFAEYEFLGIKTFEGESTVNEGFVEFHPDEDSIWEIVLDLFYEPIKNKRTRS